MALQRSFCSRSASGKVIGSLIEDEAAVVHVYSSASMLECLLRADTGQPYGY
ncbi:hypothetical protein PAMC26577_36010 [Caballeronia sordidicola]|uniref:Uncharacterized protein n=1 Tax=Caballeronia sordidicola TaxID=196367 RepID=A0A242M8W9_CABSO|nr:hypothetical protein PAMC26577_36010 [Caballeronia sordidicola]